MKAWLLVFRSSSLCQMGALCFYLLARLEPRRTISALQLVSLRGGRAAAAQFRVTHGCKGLASAVAAMCTELAEGARGFKGAAWRQHHPRVF